MVAENFSISAEFLEHRGRKLFSIFMQPASGVGRASVLFLHPFAEEMHKSRRTVAMQARLLAESGFNVMLLDLSGCGDSSGEFSDCSWQGWLEDAKYAANVLAARCEKPLILWGSRLGGLLACDLSQQISELQLLLLWQPTLNGEQQIDQFLRTQAAGMALKGEVGFDRIALWKELREGRSLNVAGYELSPQLANDISRMRLHDMKPGCPVVWLDISRPANPAPGPASLNILAGWQQQDLQVTLKCVEGEFFWRNVDAGDSPELLATTRDLLVDL